CGLRTAEMLRRIKRYARLSSSERWLFVRAFIWLGVVDLGLRTMPLPRLVGLAGSGRSRAADAIRTSPPPRIYGYARWLETASRYHIVNAHCLHRSLVLHHWLRGEGFPSELRIGVRKEGLELKAHAWVELDGEIMSDRTADITPFTPLES